MKEDLFDMIKRIVCVFTAVVLMLCSAVSSSALQERQTTVQIDAERFYSLPYDDGYTDVLGIDQSGFLSLKNKLYNAIERFDPQVDISEYGIYYSFERLNILGTLIFQRPDRPDLFQVSTVSCTYNASGLITLITPIYNRDEQLYRQQLALCEQAADGMLEGIKDSSLTDLEKALVIHDRIAKRTEYVNNNSDDDHNICGVLINGQAVCEGYAQAYCYLLSKVGIGSRLSSSLSLSHAWNLIILDGEKYNVDVTWDDPLPDIDGRVRHSNFLCSTAKFNTEGPAHHDAGDYNTDPSSTKYDNAFWDGVNSSFELLDGKLYFISADQKLCRYSQSEGITELCDASDTWVCKTNGAYYPGSYARLAASGKYLYYNLSDRIMRYDPKTGEKTVAFTPDLSPYCSGDDVAAIYGFKIENGFFVMNPATNPQFNSQTKKDNLLTKKIEQEEPPEERKFIDVLFKTLPAKTVYYIGDSYDTSGAELYARYSDGTVEALSVDDCTVSYDFSKAGERNVSITYKNFTGTYSVTVKTPSVKLTDIPLMITEGDEIVLSAVTDPEGAEIAFGTDDLELASVADNRLFARKEGTVTVTASIKLNGIEYTDKCQVKIANTRTVYGDADGNGRITASDALIILQSVVKATELDSDTAARCDVDKNGKVTAVDAMLVLRYTVGYIDSFPNAA